MVHFAGRTLQLLHCKADQQPDAGVLGFWQTLSSCLTELAINVDWTQQQLLFQPGVLTQLTALTAITFSVIDYDHGDEDHVEGSDVLHLPQLKPLHVKYYCGKHLVLECPQLTSLSMDACNPLGYVSLQAALQELSAKSSDEFAMHTGFPLTIFLDMVSLSIECTYNGEQELFQALPLMKRLVSKRLVSLDLNVNQGKFLRSLPQGLCEVSLDFNHYSDWDDAVIAMLQKLPELRELRLKFWSRVQCSLARLSSHLRPFIGLPKLRILQLGEWQAWTPDTLRALGQFEAELVRSGSKIELMY